VIACHFGFCDTLKASKKLCSSAMGKIKRHISRVHLCEAMEDWMIVIMVHSTPHYLSSAIKMVCKFPIFASLTEAAVLSEGYLVVIDVLAAQTWPLSVQRRANTFQAAEKNGIG
jgi:hypothetical protein